MRCFETPSRSSWRHSNEIAICILYKTVCQPISSSLVSKLKNCVLDVVLSLTKFIITYFHRLLAEKYFLKCIRCLVILLTRYQNWIRQRDNTVMQHIITSSSVGPDLRWRVQSYTETLTKNKYKQPLINFGSSIAYWKEMSYVETTIKLLLLCRPYKLNAANALQYHTKFCQCHQWFTVAVQTMENYALISVKQKW